MTVHPNTAVILQNRDFESQVTIFSDAIKIQPKLLIRTHSYKWHRDIVMVTGEIVPLQVLYVRYGLIVVAMNTI